MIRVAGLVTVFTVMALTLASFRTPPAIAFVMPVVTRESNPSPLLYGVDIRFEHLVRAYCDETGVPMWIACRMFGLESVGNPLAGVWNPHAVSWLGAQGLAQIMPFNLDLFSARYNNGQPIDPFDPETSIRVGLRYLADLHEMTRSWREALRSFNGGYGHWLNPAKYGPWQQESLDYSRVILGGKNETQGY